MATVAAITTDTATPAIRRIVVQASGRTAHAAMAAAVAEKIRQHLVDKDQVPNRLGGDRTHFYAAAARGTFRSGVSETEAEVTIAKDGIRQRLLGGTIRPIYKKALTIPVHPLAHGKVASEFGPELRLVVINGGSDGNTAGLLVLGKGSDAPVLFVLRTKVTQQPDPTVLPTDEEMAAEAVSALEEIALAD